MIEDSIKNFHSKSIITSLMFLKVFVTLLFVLHVVSSIGNPIKHKSNIVAPSSFTTFPEEKEDDLLILSVPTTYDPCDGLMLQY